MVRIYRVIRCIENQYTVLDYYLDPSAAAVAALRESRSLSAKDYMIVTQMDVFPSYSLSHEFLRVDGLNSTWSNCRTR